MKIKILAVFLVALACFSAEKYKPLLVMFNATEMTLSWTSSLDDKTKHVIDFKDRTMTQNGKEPKRFTVNEQVQLLQLLAALSNYVIESEDWYKDPKKYEEDHKDNHQGTKQYHGTIPPSGPTI
jgi:hypothetical protein